MCGLFISFIIRLELSQPGNIFLSGQAYNVTVTNHAFLIFFLLLYQL